MKPFATFLLLLIWGTAGAQDTCRIADSKTAGIAAVKSVDMRCLAQSTQKRQLLAITFAAWCMPCRLHLPGAISFAKENNLEFVVIIPEGENDKYTADAAALVYKIDPSVRTVVISDVPYGADRGRKYKAFLRELIPPAFPMIDDYSKYLLFNKQGEVVFVSSWKDNKGNSWKTDTAVQNQKIRPLLTQR
jgi:thiol-disulfide isomerase/thioredoxin